MKTKTEDIEDQARAVRCIRFVRRLLGIERKPCPPQPPENWWIEKNGDGRFRYATGDIGAWLLGKPCKTWDAANRAAWKKHEELEAWRRSSNFIRVDSPNVQLSDRHE